MVSSAIIIGGKLSCYTNQVVNPDTFGKIWFVWNVRCIRKILALYSVHGNYFKSDLLFISNFAWKLNSMVRWFFWAKGFSYIFLKVQHFCVAEVCPKIEIEANNVINELI